MQATEDSLYTCVNDSIYSFLVNPILFFKQYPNKFWSIPNHMREFYNILIYEFALDGWIRKHNRHLPYFDPDDVNQRIFIDRRTGTILPGSDHASDAFLPENPRWHDPGQMACPLFDPNNFSEWDAWGFLSARFPGLPGSYNVIGSLPPVRDYRPRAEIKRAAEGANEILDVFHKECMEVPTHIVAILRDVQSVYLCMTARSASPWGASLEEAQASMQQGDPMAAVVAERTMVRPALRRHYFENYRTLLQEGFNYAESWVVQDRRPQELTRWQYLLKVMASFEQTANLIRKPHEGTTTDTEGNETEFREGSVQVGDNTIFHNSQLWKIFIEEQADARIFCQKLENTGASPQAIYRNFATKLTEMITQSTQMSDAEFKAQLDQLTPLELPPIEKQVAKIMHSVALDCQILDSEHDWVRVAFVDARIRLVAIRIKTRRHYDAQNGFNLGPQTTEGNKVFNTWYSQFYCERLREDAVFVETAVVWPPDFGQDGFKYDKDDTMQAEFTIIKDYKLVKEKFRMMDANDPKMVGIFGYPPRYVSGAQGTRFDGRDLLHRAPNGVYPFFYQEMSPFNTNCLEEMLRYHNIRNISNLPVPTFVGTMSVKWDKFYKYAGPKESEAGPSSAGDDDASSDDDD